MCRPKPNPDPSGVTGAIAESVLAVICEFAKD
jgi:hypothetical protein